MGMALQEEENMITSDAVTQIEKSIKHAMQKAFIIIHTKCY